MEGKGSRCGRFTRAWHEGAEGHQTGGALCRMKSDPRRGRVLAMRRAPQAVRGLVVLSSGLGVLSSGWFRSG